MSEALKLNLGCGQHKKEGYLNVDKFGEPDLRWDLEVFPWPWEDSSVGEVVLSHVLEHLGETSEIYLGIIKELYRVCKPDAHILIRVPHPRHDDFLTDPTHVRAILPESMRLFSQRLNRMCQEKGYANSPLGLYLDVDFEVIKSIHNLEEPWQTRYTNGEISQEELVKAVRQYNNVVKEIILALQVIKEATPEAAAARAEAVAQAAVTLSGASLPQPEEALAAAT